VFAIETGRTGSDEKVRVVFSMPPIDGCGGLYLVGWFDEWNESVHRMEPRADGGWELTLELDPGCEYLYRFRTADGIWLRDPSVPAASELFGLNTSFYLSEGKNSQGALAD
jgi:hypothetical protein